MVSILNLFIEATSAHLPDSDAQGEIAKIIKAHLKEEKVLGKEIQPTAVQQCRSAAFAQAEQCKDLSTEYRWIIKLTLRSVPGD